jgi:hypothetical protein
MSKEKLNATRARMLRRLFEKEDALEDQLAVIERARAALTREFAKEEGFLIIPGRERIRELVFRKEYDRA